MKWEYKVVIKDQFNEEHLNTLGGDGWELAYMQERAGYAGRILFKRQKQEAPAPAVPAAAVESEMEVKGEPA